MIVENFFVIISAIPERISTYTSNLKTFTSDFLFFSDVKSFTETRSSASVRMLILDSVDGDTSASAQILALRQLETLKLATILVIVQESGSENGIAALNAGANDYLAYSLVNKELTVRARMHLRRDNTQNTSHELAVDFSGIYPHEDRFIIKSAIRHINNNITTIKRVSDLLAFVGGSESEINRAFTLHMNQTVSEYIRSFRINKAKKLLLKTRIPITQIADCVGYSSSANFSTAFKSAVGQSPREFRCQQL